MLHKSNLLSGGAPLAWCRGLLSLGLLAVAAACSTTPGNIGVGLPDANANTGAYLVDTLTIRTSTVLRDSLITSGGNTFLVGRYRDPQLGTVTTRSYTSLGLGGTFRPDPTQVFDSLTLVLLPDNTAAAARSTFIYGDSTRTQKLVRVRALDPSTPISTTRPSYISPKFTTVRVSSPTLLNLDSTRLVRRIRPNQAALRLRLLNSLGQQMLQDAKNGQLTTQEQLNARYPGFALLPGADDNAALVRFSIPTDGSGTALILYYHDPTDPTTVQSHSFPLVDGRHFYQATADRSVAAPALVPLTTTLQALDAARTSQQTYIQGMLGLQTKVEIPYLYNLRSFGSNLVITSAVMTAQVPGTALPTTVNLPPPAALTVSLTDVNNHQGRVINTGAAYSAVIANLAGVDQAGYSWSILEYCQNVLNNSVPNTGLLLASSTPNLPNRVVLGGPLRLNNKIQARLYLISSGQ